MRERFWILLGLALFVGLATTPFWSAHGRIAGVSGVPELQLPANAKQCVAPVAFMRSSHMQLLMQWRDDVVRGDNRRYVAFNGKVYDKNLTGTCLSCHNKEQFCDRCHSYSGVSGPSCWNCHCQPRTSIAGVDFRSVP
ncbi:MAG: sulfate reduction electron transfer complex DsrMKJOP subunit DsrJ [Acidobacteriota bacterium]